MALFGLTASEWRERNKYKEGNIRDYASVVQLICLANLENTNAIMIKDKTPSSQRIRKLNQIARHQMKLLTEKNKENKNKKLIP